MSFNEKEKILFLAKQLIGELDAIEHYNDSVFVDKVANAVWNNDTIAIETMLEELYEEEGCYYE